LLAPDPVGLAFQGRNRVNIVGGANDRSHVHGVCRSVSCRIKNDLMEGNINGSRPRSESPVPQSYSALV
jgi:hypothetical protein